MDNLIIPFSGRLNEIHDESLYTNYANSHSTPKDEKEVSLIIKECKRAGEKVTACGALTGLNGAAVPTGGHSLSTKNLKTMKYNDKDYTIQVGSGTTFEDIEKFILSESKGKREFPISPTEKTATIGGAISFNSSGLRSYKFGNIINFIEEITICNQNGDIIKLSKNDTQFSDYIGSEGMLAIITSVKLRTTQKLTCAWGIMFFFENDKESLTFVDSVKNFEEVQVIEYIDKKCFELCGKYKNVISQLESIPSIESNIESAIYVEIYSLDEERIEEIAEELMEISMNCNSDPDLAWAMSQEEMFKLQDFRHAITECYNMEVAKYNNTDTRIKLENIDIKWNSKSNIEIINYYKNLFNETNLEYFIYGHIGTNAPYVNILSKTIEEYLMAKKIVENCYKNAIINGNIIFAEFGVGKLKSDSFCTIQRIEQINKIMKTKQKYDKNGLFNPNNMFLDNEA